MSELLRVENLQRRVGDVEILRDIGLSVAKGEVLGIIGPSGSGKSSLLRCIAGLDPLSGGRVTVEGRQARPGDGAIGMVFQNFALWPHLSAEENVAMPLRVARKMPRAFMPGRFPTVRSARSRGRRGIIPRASRATCWSSNSPSPVFPAWG